MKLPAAFLFPFTLLVMMCNKTPLTSNVTGKNALVIINRAEFRNLNSFKFWDDSGIDGDGTGLFTNEGDFSKSTSNGDSRVSNISFDTLLGNITVNSGTITFDGGI